MKPCMQAKETLSSAREEIPNDHFLVLLFLELKFWVLRECGDFVCLFLLLFSGLWCLLDLFVYLFGRENREVTVKRIITIILQIK